MEFEPAFSNPPTITGLQEVAPTCRVASSEPFGWRGIVVTGNIERPGKFGEPPIAHHHINVFAHAPVRREHRGGLSKSQLRRVNEHIDDRLCDDLRLGDLAALIGMSEFHFSRQFKRTTGLAPHQYLVRRRVERAKRLLRETDMPVAEVALNSGFAHQSHLSNWFRRAVRTSPARYRAALRP